MTLFNFISNIIKRTRNICITIPIPNYDLPASSICSKIGEAVKLLDELETFHFCPMDLLL
uniref:Uncharacterized protein n=1 Tax=Romanomermis culicivorax TaxID=13658 RepID=A0A915JU17_ROMCU